jgi:gamma-glutamylcyclotransferase (GGCT)/AIG2-like uncharacterized protein YtfP
MCNIDTTGTVFDGYGDSKLFKVNLTSLATCGTLEFRQHGGTTEVEEIVMWIKLLIRFCSVVLGSECPSPLTLAENPHPLDALFNQVLNDAEIKAYYLKRMDIRDLEEPLDIQTRPIFLYGTLMSTSLLALVLLGDRNKAATLSPHLKKAVLGNFHRGRVVDKDYPALVKTKEGSVDGVGFYPRNIDDRRKINNFEGEQYAREIVKVTTGGEEVEVSTYIWSGQDDEVSEMEWDAKEFESSRLPDWLDLFEGMEFLL